MVVDMENNGKLTYAIVRINFNDYTLTINDICLPQDSNRTVKLCAPGDKVGGGKFDPQTNMPILQATQFRDWGATIGEAITLEHMQKRLDAENFYLELITFLAFHSDGTFIAGAISEIPAYQPTPTP